MELTVGMERRERVTVGPRDCASEWGNEALMALSTPALLGHMERVCVRALKPHLAGGMMSVGTFVELRHLAAAPVGTEVELHVVLRQTDGRRLVFACEAYDGERKLGEARHERHVVDRGRFEESLRRLTR